MMGGMTDQVQIAGAQQSTMSAGHWRLVAASLILLAPSKLDVNVAVVPSLLQQPNEHSQIQQGPVVEPLLKNSSITGDK
jgi:hypothetical protein